MESGRGVARVVLPRLAAGRDGLDQDDVSLGRVPDGGDTWALFGPDEARAASPGATNGD